MRSQSELRLDAFLVGFLDQHVLQEAAGQFASRRHVVFVDLLGEDRRSGGDPIEAAEIIDSKWLVNIERLLIESARRPDLPNPSGAQLERAVELSSRDFHRQMDRVFPRRTFGSYSASFQTMLCAFWLGQLLHLEPTIVVFARSPHFPWDTALLHSAEALSIPTYTLSATHLNGIGRVHRGISNRPDSAVEFPLDLPFVASGDDLVAEFGKVSSRIEMSDDINHRLRKQGWRRRSRWGLARRKAFVLRSSEGPLAQYMIMGRRERFRAVTRHQRQIAAWRRELASLSSEPPTGTPFVYFALHYQPEQSTDPEASLYSDQVLATHSVRAELPPEVALVVKEHPRQLLNYPPDLRTSGYRHLGFYEAIGRLPNTFVVDPLADAAQMIGEAVAVVTSTGSSGWQGLRAGVPAVLLADAWYSGFASSPLVRRPEDFCPSFRSVLGKSPSDVRNDVLNFLHHPNGQLLRIVNAEVYARNAGIKESELVHNVSEVLEALLRIGDHQSEKKAVPPQ